MVKVRMILGYLRKAVNMPLNHTEAGTETPLRIVSPTIDARKLVVKSRTRIIEFTSLRLVSLDCQRTSRVVPPYRSPTDSSSAQILYQKRPILSIQGDR